jgi:hypothetical protein
MKKQNPNLVELPDDELEEVSGGVVFAPIVQATPYIPGQGVPAAKTLEFKGGPIQVQNLPAAPGGLNVQKLPATGVAPQKPRKKPLVL